MRYKQIFPRQISHQWQRKLGIIIYNLNTFVALIILLLLILSIEAKYVYSRDLKNDINLAINLTFGVIILFTIFILLVHAIGAKLAIDLSRPSTRRRKLWHILMKPWLVLLCIVIFCTFLLAILSLLKRFQTGKSTKNDVRNAMSKYATDIKKKAFIDEIQITKECCGVESYEDWFRVEWIADKFADKDWGVTDGLTDSVPFSCCNPKSFGPCIHHQLTQPAKHLRHLDDELSIYTAGCGHHIVQTLKWIFLILYLGFFVSVFLQIVILILACYLFTSITSMCTARELTDAGVGHLYGFTFNCNNTGTNECSSSSHLTAGSTEESSTSRLSSRSDQSSNNQSKFFSRLRSGGFKDIKLSPPPPPPPPPLSKTSNRHLPPLRPVFPSNYRRNLSPMF